MDRLPVCEVGTVWGATARAARGSALRSFGVPEPAGYEKWLAREDVRRALHANHHRFGSTAGLVSSFLTPDIFRSEMWRGARHLVRPPRAD